MDPVNLGRGLRTVAVTGADVDHVALCTVCDALALGAVVVLACIVARTWGRFK